MIRPGFLIVAFLLAAAACTGGGTPTTPTPATPTTITETFNGTLNRNGAETHPFTVASSGSVQATLSKVEPDNTVLVGLSLGTWNGIACKIELANDNATQGSTITATVSSAGLLCVRVYDVGAVVDPLTYEVQVVHP